MTNNSISRGQSLNICDICNSLQVFFKACCSVFYLFFKHFLFLFNVRHDTGCVIINIKTYGCDPSYLWGYPYYFSETLNFCMHWTRDLGDFIIKIFVIFKIFKINLWFEYCESTYICSFNIANNENRANVNGLNTEIRIKYFYYFYCF